MMLLNLIKFADCFDYNLMFFNSDKLTYYNNENIEINASWYLNYDEENEYAYIQIQIFNSINILIWNSSTCNTKGVNEKNWSLNITDLCLDFNNYSNLIYIKFLCFYTNFDSGDNVGIILGTIKIELLKREVSYELRGFKSSMIYGEDQLFNMSFYDISENNMTYLMNVEVNFEIFSNESLLYKTNFTTNQVGFIEIYISSIKHLRFGENFLMFTLIDNRIYNDSKFIFKITMFKKQIYINIVEYSEHLKLSEDLKLNLIYYYFSNNTITPLNDSDIILKIFDKGNLIFLKEYRTDTYGSLNITISPEILNIEKKVKQLRIIFIFNGNHFIENKTLSLNLKIVVPENSILITLFQSNMISLLLILTFILIIFVVIFRKFKQNKEILLEKMMFKY